MGVVVVEGIRVATEAAVDKGFQWRLSCSVSYCTRGSSGRQT